MHALDPLIVAPLAASAAIYAAGVARLWRRAGGGRGITVWAAASFALGWLTLAISLLSPIARLSELLFSVHMTQHALLMLVAAPLMAFGQPILACLWAVGEARRERVARAFRGHRIAATWNAVSAPLSVFLIHAAVLWLWHVPAWFEAALRSDSIHAVQHLSFVVAASLFWWAMVHGRYGRIGYGLSVVYVFLTAIHSGALGALLTVAPSAWYGEYIARAGGSHHAALADQQLAGLLMWVPAGVIFILLGLALFAAWMGEAERRVRFGATDAASRLR
jgi:putative membrane protein